MNPKPKIVWVNPPNDATWGELAEGGSTLPPFGIAILAAIVRANGYPTKIFDFLATRDTVGKTLPQVLDEQPDVVGITATTEMIISAHSFAQKIKEKNSECLIIIGGIHITSIPEDTMQRCQAFDIGVIGEGEVTIIELLANIHDPKQLRQVKGLILRENDKLFITGKREHFMELDSLPFPAWNLLPKLDKHYQPAVTNYLRTPVAALVSSRGCPGKCVFCDRSMFGNKCRGYSADYVVAMIDDLIERFKIREICFYDDTFVALKSRLKDICRQIVKNKLDITWSCNARVDLVDPDNLKMMKSAGCWQIAYGIETGDQQLLDSLKKGITLDQIRQALSWTKDAGIATKGFFIIGLPGETKKSIEKTFNFALELPLDDILLEYFTPFPGTDIYQSCSEYGIVNTGWDRLNTFDLNFIPNGLDEEYLRKQFKNFYSKFYLRPKIILNYVKRFSNPFKLCRLVISYLKFAKGYN